MSSQEGTRTGLLQVAAAGVLWGTGGLAVQVVRDVVPMSVVTISAWRMLVAAVVLVAVLLARRRLGSLRALLRQRPGPVVVVGACTAAYQALYFAAVVTAGVSVATVVSLGLAPVLVTTAEAVAARTRPRPDRLAVVGTALVGLVLVAGAAHGGDGPRPALGVLLAAGSGAAYALTTVLGRSLAQGADPITLTTGTTTVGAVVLVPLALVAGLGGDGGPLVSGDPVVVATLLYLGVLTMALAYGLLYAGLRTTTGGAAVVATLLEPVTAAVLAALLLDERLGVVGWLGAALVLVAVAGLGREPAVPPG